MKRAAKHLPHYFSLLGIFAAGIAGFVIFSYDKQFQAVLTIAIAIAYVLWGIIHHLLHKDLYFAVVLEYLLYAILGVVIVFSVLLR